MRIRNGSQNRYNNSKLGRSIKTSYNDDDDYEPRRIRFNTSQIFREIPSIPNQGCLIQCPNPNYKARGGTSWEDFTHEFNDPDSLLNQTDDKIRDAFKSVEDELGYIFDPNKNGLREFFESFRNGMKGVFEFLRNDKLFNLELDPNKNGVNAIFAKFKDDWNGAFQELGQKMLDFYRSYLFPTPLLSLLGRGFKPLGDFFQMITDKDWWEEKLNDPETYFFIAQSILLCSSAFLGPGGAALAAGVIAAARLITKAAMNEPILATDILEMGLCLLPQGRIIAGPPGKAGVQSFGQFVMEKVTASIRNLKAADPNARARFVGQGLCACVAVGQDIGLVPPINKKGYIKTAIDNSNKDIERKFTGEQGYKKKYTTYIRDEVLIREEPYTTMEAGKEVTKMRPVYKQLNSYTTYVIELDDFKDRDIIPKVLAQEEAALSIMEYWEKNKIAQQDIDDYYNNDLTKDIPVDVVSGTDLKTGISFNMSRPKIPNLGSPPKVGNIYLHIQTVPYLVGDFVAKSLNASYIPPKASETAWQNDPKIRIFECMRNTKDVSNKDNMLPLPPKAGETFQSVFEKGAGVWRECTLEYANNQPNASIIVDPRQYYIEQAAKYRELYNTMIKNERYATDLARDRLIIQDRLQKEVLVDTTKANGAFTWLTFIIDNEVTSYTRRKSEPALDTTYMSDYHTKYWTTFFQGPNFFRTPEEGKAFYEKNPTEMPEIPEYTADNYGTDFHKQVQLHMERFFNVDFAPINQTHACTHFTFRQGANLTEGDQGKETDSLICPFDKTTAVGKSTSKTNFPSYAVREEGSNQDSYNPKTGFWLLNYWSYARVVDELEKEINRNYRSVKNLDDDRDTAKFESLEAYNLAMFNMTRQEKVDYLRKLHTTADFIIESYAKNKPDVLLKDSLIWNKEKKRIDIPSIQVLKQTIPEIGLGEITYAGMQTLSKPGMKESEPVFFPFPVAPPLKIVGGRNDESALAALAELKRKGEHIRDYQGYFPGGEYGGREMEREKGRKMVALYEKTMKDMIPDLLPFPQDWLDGNIPLELLARVFKGVKLDNPKTGVIKELSQAFFINYFLQQDIDKGQQKAKDRYYRPVEVQVRYDNASPEQRKEIERLENLLMPENVLNELRNRSIGGPPDFRPDDTKERTIELWNEFKNVQPKDRPYSREDLDKKGLEKVKNASTLIAAQNPDFFEVYSTINPPVVDFYMNLMRKKDLQEGTTVNFDTAKTKQDAYLAKVKANYDTQRRIRKAKGLDDTLTTDEQTLKNIKDQNPLQYEYDERYRQATDDQKRIMDSWNSPILFSWGAEQKWMVDENNPNAGITNIMPLREKLKLARSNEYGYKSDWRAETKINELTQSIELADSIWNQALENEHSSKITEITKPWNEYDESTGDIAEKIKKYEDTWAKMLAPNPEWDTGWTSNMVTTARQNLKNELGLTDADYEKYRNGDYETFDLEAMHELLRLEDVRYAKARGIRDANLLEDAYNENSAGISNFQNLERKLYTGLGKPSKRRKYNKFYKY